MEVSIQQFLEELTQSEQPLCLADNAGRCIVSSVGLQAALGLHETPSSLTEFWPDFSGNPKTFWSGNREFIDVSGATQMVQVIAVPLTGCALYIFTGSNDFTGNDSASEDQQSPGAEQSQRLETLGMLAGGIAHDFNNVLTGILGHVSYLKTVLPRSGPHAESIGAIEEGARKASSMTHQILTFSKVNPEEKPAPIDLVAVVKSSLRILKGALPLGCVLECDLPESPQQVLAAEGRITQILINLVVNARDAVPANGRIDVSIDSTADLEELNAAFQGADLSSRRYARLIVSDNGHGITDEVQRRMFEPYFSTKKALGTGLGLATVLQSVRQFGGAITVDSQVEVGTRITVYLPMLHAEAPQESSSDSEQRVLRGDRERILIVDDEYSVRNVLSVSLQHLGYEIEAVSSGTEALERYSSGALPFDLVILDMIMPEMSGDRVFAELVALDPQVRVLVISGYSSEAAVQSILDNGGLDFMSKPFTIGELSRKVRQCLAPGGV